MILKYKDTFFDYEFKRSNNKSGLSDGNFWITVDLTIKNDEIDTKYVRDAISYFELKELVKKLENFVYNDGSCEKIVLIKHFDEFELLKGKQMMQKFYFYDDVFKYYTLYYTEDEIKWFIEKNKKFLEEQ